MWRWQAEKGEESSTWRMRISQGRVSKKFTVGHICHWQRLTRNLRDRRKCIVCNIFKLSTTFSFHGMWNQIVWLQLQWDQAKVKKWNQIFRHRTRDQAQELCGIFFKKLFCQRYFREYIEKEDMEEKVRRGGGGSLISLYFSIIRWPVTSSSSSISSSLSSWGSQLRWSSSAKKSI